MSSQFPAALATLLILTVHILPAWCADQRKMWCTQGELTNNRDEIKYVSCDEEYKQIHKIPDSHYFPPTKHCLLFADTKKNTERDGYDWIVSGGCDFDRVCDAFKEDKLITNTQFNGSTGNLFCCDSTRYYCNDPRITLMKNATSVLKTCFKGAENQTTHRLEGTLEPCGVNVYCTVETDSKGVDQYFCDDDNICLSLTVSELNQTCNQSKSRGACCCEDPFCNKPNGVNLKPNQLIPEKQQPNITKWMVMFYFTITLSAVLFLSIVMFCVCCCIRCQRNNIDHKYLEKYRDYHLQFEDSEEEEGEMACEGGAEDHRVAASSASAGPLPSKDAW